MLITFNFSGNRAQSNCPSCNATPTLMSKPDSCFHLKPETLPFGFSPCHFGMRSMELCLHIGYHMGFKKPSCTQDWMKKLKAKAKKDIHDKILEDIPGLRVDEVRKDGGTSNDGNTARRCFENAAIFANACGIPVEMVCLLRTLWLAMKSKLPIDADKFQEVGDRFMELYFNEFYTDDLRKTWYHMCPTVHRPAVHGKQMIEFFNIPPGFLSEEGAESNNKEFRFIRRSLTRKCNRTATMEDLVARLLCKSDPVVLSFSTQSRKKMPIPEDLRKLLKNPVESLEIDQFEEDVEAVDIEYLHDLEDEFATSDQENDTEEPMDVD